MKPPPRGVAILGSTGSIGRQALEVVQAFPDRLRVVSLAAQRSMSLLAEQWRVHRPETVVVGDEAAGEEFKSLCGSETPSRILVGRDGLMEAAAVPEAEVVLISTTGIVSLLPLLEAIRAGKHIALANKESLVAGGEVVLRELANSTARLLPVDSEHSALYQLLAGEPKSAVEKVILTASGAATLRMPWEELATLTPAQALKHPTWAMGPKITIDSATLMNKGLEVIEAMRLFGLTLDQVQVLIHPQSVVHALVLFADGAYLAHLGAPDMRIPIQYALLGERAGSGFRRIDLSECGPLTFSPVDERRYPCLPLAYDAARIGGTATGVLNAANEIAVHAFLAGRIPFLDIARVVRYTLENHQATAASTLEQVLQADEWARQVAQEFVDRDRTE